MTRWPTRIALLVLLVSVVALVFETKRMAAEIGDAERAAHQASEQALLVENQLRELSLPSPDQSEQQNGNSPAPAKLSGASTPDRSPTDQAMPGAQAGSSAAAPPQDPNPTAPVDLNTFTRLRLDLHTTRQQLAAVTKLLEQRNAEIEQRRTAAAQAAKNSMKPMPAGVRLCLDTLHDCLRSEGYTNQRFLRAGSLDAEGLHDVEMLESSTDGLAVTFLSAKLMTAALDRGTGLLQLRFFDGHRDADGERASLPEDGFAITFEEVEGPLFEGRLPYLVRGDGAYSMPVTEAGRPATDVDPGTRRQWLTRLDNLLDMAKTKDSWRVTRLRGMSDGHFLTVELIGTDDKNLVKASAHCDQLAVEIDEQGGVVSLLLQGGVLRRGSLESTITGEGYRMLLPGLTPKETIDAMQGMVVKK
ncbi:MAG: hypothetical protein ACI8UD_000339 [Planctomycetota bacterium]|jgi:hypothetical protein